MTNAHNDSRAIFSALLPRRSDGSQPSTIQSNSSVARPSIFSLLLPRPCNRTTEPDHASLGSRTHSFGVQSSSHSASASRSLPSVTPDAEISPASSSSNGGYVRNPTLVRNRSSSGPRMAPYQRVSSEAFAWILRRLLPRPQTCPGCEGELLLFLVSLRFGRLGFQGHGDLNIGIHGISFEELLALEERRTTESTSITVEKLSECLKTNNIAATQMSNSITVRVEKDMVCVICQEEFAGDDVVCQLLCKHIYHFACIWQWLQLRNCCPMCKSSALP